jgi:ribosomal protein S18 acetylase RimI-like enzyme
VAGPHPRPIKEVVVKHGSAGIRYRLGNDLDLDQVIELYHASTLGERRPVDSRECMAQMLREADLVVTAWEGEMLVGIARTLTDHCYVAYLADLAVRVSHQRRGIGRELVRATRRELGDGALVVLLAAPAAVDYYPRIGFTRHDQAWVLKPGDPLVD